MLCVTQTFQNDYLWLVAGTKWTRCSALFITLVAWICVQLRVSMSRASMSRAGDRMFNVWFVSSRVEEMGALMVNLEKANQVSVCPPLSLWLRRCRREDNHLPNQALSLIRPSSSPTTLLVLALADPWLPATLSHDAVRAAEDGRERDVANEEGC